MGERKPSGEEIARSSLGAFTTRKEGLVKSSPDITPAQVKKLHDGEDKIIAKMGILRAKMARAFGGGRFEKRVESGAARVQAKQEKGDFK